MEEAWFDDGEIADGDGFDDNHGDHLAIIATPSDESREVSPAPRPNEAKGKSTHEQRPTKRPGRSSSMRSMKIGTPNSMKEHDLLLADDQPAITEDLRYLLSDINLDHAGTQTPAQNVRSLRAPPDRKGSVQPKIIIESRQNSAVLNREEKSTSSIANGGKGAGDLESTPDEDDSTEALVLKMKAAAERMDFVEAQRIKLMIEKRSSSDTLNLSAQPGKLLPDGREEEIKGQIQEDADKLQRRSEIISTALSSRRARILESSLECWRQWHEIRGKKIAAENQRKAAHPDGLMGPDEISALVENVKQKLLRIFVQKKRQCLLSRGLHKWLEGVRIASPMKKPNVKKDRDPVQDEDKRKGDMAPASDNNSGSSEGGGISSTGGALQLYRVIDEDGVCFRVSPSHSEACRHPEEEGVDLGDLVMGIEGPPGWIKTFPERYYVPLHIHGHKVLETAKLRKAKKAKAKADACKEGMYKVLQDLRTSMHHDVDDAQEEDSDSDFDVDDVGGAIEAGGHADIHDVRSRGPRPPIFPMATGTFRITIQEILSIDEKDITASSVKENVLTGVAKLIPEWERGVVGWAVKRIALHIFTVGGDSDSKSVYVNEPMALPKAGQFVAKYELEGSLVECDQTNSSAFTVHLPGRTTRLVIECPSQKLTFEKEVPEKKPKRRWSWIRRARKTEEEKSPKSVKSSGPNSPGMEFQTRHETANLSALPTALETRSEWISLIALCSGPPEFIDVGSTLRAMLALLVLQIEEEGRKNATAERVEELHHLLASISKTVAMADNWEKKKNEKMKEEKMPKGANEVLVTAEIPGLGSTSMMCKLHETVSTVKLRAVTRIVQRRQKSANSGQNPPPRRHSLQLKDYRISVLGRGRPERCEDDQKIGTILQEFEKHNISHEEADTKSNRNSDENSIRRLEFRMDPKMNDPEVNQLHPTNVVEEHF